MRTALSLMALLLIFVLGFQNCSSARNDPGFFVQADYESSGLDESDCYATGCVSPEEMLWINILESNPYTLNKFYITSGHFTVGGLCGTGTFFRHTVAWEVKASGSQTRIGNGTVDDACINGRFTVPVPVVAQLANGQRYELTLELIGFGEGGIPISNPLPNNLSRVDIVVINQETVPAEDPMM